MLLLTPITSFLWHTVLANSLILVLITVFIFRNTKDKTFFWYALYNTLLLLYILPKNNGVFNLSFFDIRGFSSFNWYIQILYNSCLTYFGISFLNLKNYFPKLTKIAHKFLFWLIIISTLGYVVAIIFNQHKNYFYFFTYVYVPVHFSLSLYFLYLATRVTEKTRYYYFVGVFSYMLFAIISLVLSVTNNIYFSDSFTAISLFYIGVLIESVSFTFGLGERVKTIYAEKISIQKELASTQQKLNKELQQKIEKIEIEKKLTDLEFSLMTSKMNSHFLFNTLNSIKLFIIENDVKNAVSYLGKFAEFIRKILETSSVKTIQLEEELYTSKLYVDIENIRFNNEIDFVIRIADTNILKNTRVPPFILQPFLENAIWHGIATKKEKKIILSIARQDNKIHIEIEDNGIGRKQALTLKKKRNEYKKSVGLSIIKDILTNAYSNSYSLNFVDLVDQDNLSIGTKAVLKLPLKTIKKSKN